MYTQEFVEDYVKSHKSKFKKFFVIQLIIDILLMIIFVLAIIKFIDNLSYVYICVAIFFVVLEATLFFNLKKFFGGFKKFVKSSSINRSYSDAVVEFKKTNDQARFDEKLSEIEIKIREK